MVSIAKWAKPIQEEEIYLFDRKICDTSLILREMEENKNEIYLFFLLKRLNNNQC